MPVDVAPLGLVVHVRRCLDGMAVSTQRLLVCVCVVPARVQGDDVVYLFCCAGDASTLAVQAEGMQT